MMDGKFETIGVDDCPVGVVRPSEIDPHYPDADIYVLVIGDPGARALAVYGELDDLAELLDRARGRIDAAREKEVAEAGHEAVRVLARETIADLTDEIHGVGPSTLDLIALNAIDSDDEFVFGFDQMAITDVIDEIRGHYPDAVWTRTAAWAGSGGEA